MAHLDRVAGAVTLALGLLAMAAVVSTDAYSVGARTDARSYKVVTHMIADNGTALCLNDATQDSQADAQ
ncbi:MAG TPA: hypothetical protein VIF60_16305 [Burkholderiaceae bacterium]